MGERKCERDVANEMEINGRESGKRILGERAGRGYWERARGNAVGDNERGSAGHT
tara:strand:+ start:620 stop:784 length:165 start_codon:yes stop_codon:yes gene_type:complete